jgi:protein-S-isoprenylcysteine O-methyltransferase Ste14
MLPTVTFISVFFDTGSPALTPEMTMPQMTRATERKLWISATALLLATLAIIAGLWMQRAAEREAAARDLLQRNAERQLQVEAQLLIERDRAAEAAQRR